MESRSLMSVSLPAIPAPARPVPPLASQEVLGVPLALTDYTSTLDWIDAAVAARQRAYICVAAVHTVMESQEDPELRAGRARLRLHRPRRPAARVGDEPARPQPLEPRLRARPDGARLRARRPHRPALLPLRRARVGARRPCATSCRGATPACAIAGVRPGPFRELSPEEADVDRRRAQRRRARRDLGRPRRAAAGEVDGRDARAGSTRRCSSASAPPSTSTPASSARRPTACSGSGSSGRSGSCRSRGGCGGAISTTTRASSSGSRANMRAICARAGRVSLNWSGGASSALSHAVPRSC